VGQPRLCRHQFEPIQEVKGPSATADGPFYVQKQIQLSRLNRRLFSFDIVMNAHG
jgi:hypothetical protein